jgi:hypothetical protein
LKSPQHVTGLVLLVGDVGAATADVPVGPGPTNYTDQPQPAPGTCHYRTAANGETLPDRNCTPAAISPKVTQDTLAITICKTGYTKSIRPPASITAAEKRGNAAAYGYSGPLSGIEYDHLVPLQVGGDPNDPRNLWVEPGESENPKDGVESKLHQRVCGARFRSRRRRRRSQTIGPPRSTSPEAQADSFRQFSR